MKYAAPLAVILASFSIQAFAQTFDTPALDGEIGGTAVANEEEAVKAKIQGAEIVAMLERNRRAQEDYDADLAENERLATIAAENLASYNLAMAQNQRDQAAAAAAMQEWQSKFGNIPGPSETASAVVAAPTDDNAPARRVCTRTQTTDSMIGAKKVCHTVEDPSPE